jgi:hypothetical protein
MTVDVQEQLTRLNRMRLAPAIPAGEAWEELLEEEIALRRIEHAWIEQQRTAVADVAAGVPRQANAFVAWFETLKDVGPGQHDPLFPWLASSASLFQMRWFLGQEVAGEAGFDDLVALTQLRMPDRAKLELGANYWDELGRGHAGGMHGPMLGRLADALKLADLDAPIVSEALAVGNLLAGFAANRQYAYQSIGALGVVELTAPARASQVNLGLKRLGVPAGIRQYYALHATLDVKHSETWNREVLTSLVEENGACAPLIAEGALLRLAAGARSFERYRDELQIDARVAA